MTQVGEQEWGTNVWRPRDSELTLPGGQEGKAPEEGQYVAEGRAMGHVRMHLVCAKRGYTWWNLNPQTLVKPAGQGFF